LSPNNTIPTKKRTAPQLLVVGGFNPFKKYARQKWVHLSQGNRGENKNVLKNHRLAIIRVSMPASLRVEQENTAHNNNCATKRTRKDTNCVVEACPRLLSGCEKYPLMAWLELLICLENIKQNPANGGYSW